MKRMFEPCKYRPDGVDCNEQGCGRCGWNYDVQAKRKAKIRKEKPPKKYKPTAFTQKW